MFLKIVIVIAVIIAGILLYAATKPDTYRVQRAIDVQAPPEKVFALINDLHNWPRWAKEDSSVQRSYRGAQSGIGAVSEWSGRGNAGQGRMTIVESAPGKIVVQVDWVKPFVAHNRNEFTFEARGTSTNITWNMQGTNVYMLKLMSVFLNMDKFMGKHFEDGLANLKAAAER